MRVPTWFVFSLTVQSETDESKGFRRAVQRPLERTIQPLRYHFSTGTSYVVGKWFRTWPKRQAPV